MSYVRTMSLGQRSRSQSTLTVCALASYVQAIISSCMVVFENCLAQMITKPRQCVLCKNHVATSKGRFTVCSYSLCIGLNETYLCPAHNFVVGPASGMVRYKDLVFHPFVWSHQGAVLIKALLRRGHQCPVDTFLFWFVSSTELKA